MAKAHWCDLAGTILAMEKSLFQSRLFEAVEAARDFAGRFCLENLPAPIRCRVRLNSSYDGNPLHEVERVYPADRSLEQRLATRQMRVHG